MSLKPYKTIFLTWVFLAMVSKSVVAEHIVGGEMTYVCNGDGTYTFTMKLYRDCNSSGAPFDNPGNFAVFDDNNFLVDQVQATVISEQEIDPTFNSPCLDFPPDICVEEGTYQFTIALNTDVSGYQVVYQRCCRNQTVQNLNNPAAQGLTIVAEVPPSSAAICNSSPVFNSFPPPVLCSFEQLVFDHSATDPDGDELIYSLCSPYIGGTQVDPLPIPASNPPYDQVVWAGGYSAIDPLDADPGLTIDPNTGILTGIPQIQGQYVVGVCVEEWRDGVLLGVNKRDFQFNVAPCEATSEVILADIESEQLSNQLCDDLIFNFENLSDPANEFVWDYGDPTTEEDIEVTYDGSYTYPDTGTYVVTVVSNPGAFCSDTAQIVLPVYFEAEVEIESSTFECIDGSPVYSFTAGGEFEPESQIIWDFGPNATPQQLEGLTVEGISFSGTGLQTIEVQALNNICEAQSTLTFNVPDPPQAEISPQEAFCQGLQVTFSQTSENASIFNWDFGDPNTDGDVSNAAQPSYTFTEPGVYTVSLTASNPDNCPVTVEETFDVQILLAPEIPDQPIACFDGHAFDFEAGGSYSSNAVFQWTFPEGTPGSSSAQNPSGITYAEPGEKEVLLTVLDNGCEESVESSIELHPNPEALFDVFPQSGCVPLSVSFINQSITESSAVSYDWDFGDGSISVGSNAIHEYTQPGVYSVSLHLENLNGCIDSDEVVLENIVEVTPGVEASFIVEPNPVSVLDPQIEVTGLSENVSNCTYIFDGMEFNSCDFQHTLVNVEPQTILLSVENEFGCKGRAETEITLTDHLIYIPNAFTPDGDGINDLFKPSIIGVVEMRMWIFDRWGSLVYYTEDPTGWNGQGKDGTHYVKSDVYSYKIVITDFEEENFEYLGSVRLIR
jgi:gliding motility-associated-like protein